MNKRSNIKTGYILERKESMNKDEVSNILKKYKFDKNNIIVISGAALVLQGITENTSDIDLCVSKEYYDYLLNNYECKYERTNEYGIDCYTIDNVINFGTSFKPKDYKKIGGYKVASLKDCYDVKKFLNRKKDKDILKKIQMMLEK